MIFAYLNTRPDLCWLISLILIYRPCKQVIPIIKNAIVIFWNIYFVGAYKIPTIHLQNPKKKPLPLGCTSHWMCVHIPVINLRIKQNWWGAIWLYLKQFFWRLKYRFFIDFTCHWADASSIFDTTQIPSSTNIFVIFVLQKLCVRWFFFAGIGKFVDSNHV